MTLGRRGRGTGGRPTVPLGGRDDRRGSATPPASGDVEVEELPAQQVASRCGSRPGIGASLGVVAVLAILAAGFGVLGGRGSPTATAAVGAGPSVVPPATPAYTGEQLMTPTVPCQPAGEGVPGLTLNLSERAIPGDTEVVESLGPVPPEPTAAAPEPLTSRAPMDVRSDVVAEIRTDGDVCAVAWLIQLDDPRNTPIVIEAMGNPSRNPLVAVQNRFWLPLAQYRGSAGELHATLTYPSVVVRSRWSIRILPFQAPSATLTSNGQLLDLGQGCDVQLTLASGWSERVDQCFADIDRALDPASITAETAPLVFRFEEGWHIEGPAVACGHLSPGLTFSPDPACNVPWKAETASLTIYPPGAPGSSALAIATCGTQELADATNQICGTWYASLDVRR